MRYLLALLAALSFNAQATVIYLANFESETCNGTLTDAVSAVDGKLWDIYFENAINPLPTVRCTGGPTGGGSKFVEWNNGASQHDNLIEVLQLGTTSMSAGQTWYMAAFVRIDKDTATDVYQTTNSFDKLLEFRGTGLRWGIGAGYANGNYPNYQAGKFIWDVWCAASAVTDCETSGGGPDHKVPNASPYNANWPYYADYGRWYAVVIGITMQSTATGRIEMWVNGTKTHDITQTTMNAGATITSMMAMGTISQPGYNAPAHTRKVDRWILTDTWTDVSTTYMSDPSGGADATPPTVSAGYPSGSIAYNTTSVSMSVVTNESATCKFDTLAGTAYGAMVSTFTTTGGTSHSTTVGGLTNGSNYTRYVRCSDAAANANTSDYTVTWSVANAPATWQPWWKNQQRRRGKGR